VRLEGAVSEADAAARVPASRDGFVPRFRTWVIGGGWDQNLWPGGALPTRASLSAIANPVILQRVDFHAVWVNDAALEIAGVTRDTPDPAGGLIVRDAAGEPTGVLIDNACDLVWKHVPPLSAEQIATDVREAMRICASFGVTCVHDMMMSPEVWAVLTDLERRGELTVRVRAYMHGPLERTGGSEMLRMCGIKLFADGALGSRGAALREPYSDDPSTSGLLLLEPADLNARAAAAHAAGQQIAIHAIGDRAAELAVEAIEHAQSTIGRRHRVEHAQTMPAELFARFAKADITASMQPEHCACDFAWAQKRLGPQRMQGAYAWRTFLQHGVRLALGSDAPIASPNPWSGIRAAVTSEHVAQRLTVREALEGYTRADATHDTSLGTLKPGAAADFIVVSHDPFATLDKIQVLRTVLAGTTIYEASR
jgi:predicted amidohydrolase YtcJ